MSDDAPRTGPTPKGTHGGARPGAGRKPKAVRQLRAQLTPGSPSADPHPLRLACPPAECPNGPSPEPTAADATAAPPIDHREAAEYALALFINTLKDDRQDLDLRLDCAREVLNRTIGKPRVSAEANVSSLTELGGVHVYMPDNARPPQQDATARGTA